MKKSELVGLIATPLMMFALSLPAWADSTPTTCKDGTTSTSTGKGTCSGHGGVQKAGTSAAPAAPRALPRPLLHRQRLRRRAPPAPARTAPPPRPPAKGPAAATAACRRQEPRRPPLRPRRRHRPLRLQHRRPPSPRPLRIRRPLRRPAIPIRPVRLPSARMALTRNRSTIAVLAPVTAASPNG